MFWNKKQSDSPVKIADAPRAPLHILDKKTDVSDGSFRAFYGKAANLQSRKDVLSNSTYSRSYRIPQEVLENVYMDSWVGQRIVQIPVERAMRNGLILDMENKEDEEKVWKLYEEMGIEDMIVKAQKSADIYGNCMILLEDPTQDPLRKARDFRKLNPIMVEFPFYTVTPSPINPYQPGIVNFTLPGITADESFCAAFSGVQTIGRLAPTYKYYGMSVYQAIWSALVNDSVIMTACANITWRSSIRHYKLKGLQQQVLAGKEDQALARTSLLDESVGIFGSAVLDSEDDLQVITQTLTGLAEIDRRSAERLAAATGIPATLLLGKAPDGQNSTGKHDSNNMIDYVIGYQQKMLPPIQRIFAALVSLAGFGEQEWSVRFKHPSVVDLEARPDYDKKILENAQSMQALGLPQEVVGRYLLENEVITIEEHNEVQSSLEEFDKIDETDGEDKSEESVQQRNKAGLDETGYA